MYPDKPSSGGIFIFNSECAPMLGHRSEYRPRRVEVEGSVTPIYSRIKKKTRYRELNFILIIRPKNVEYSQSQPAAEWGGRAAWRPVAELWRPERDAVPGRKVLTKPRQGSYRLYHSWQVGMIWSHRNKSSDGCRSHLQAGHETTQEKACK